MHRMVLALIISLVASSIKIPQAWAGLHFCNDTDAPWLEVAISHPNGSGDWVAEGWWRIAQGRCRTVISGPLNSRYYYFLANGPGGTWFSGETPYCIQRERFAFNQTRFGRPGERNPADCAQAGLQFAKFRQLNTNDSKDFTNRMQGGPPPNLSAGAPSQQPYQPPASYSPPRPPTYGQMPQPAPVTPGAEGDDACKRYPNLC